MASILLIDASHLYWTHWHSCGDMELSEAFIRTIGTIAKIRHGYDYVAVACDGPPYLRTEQFSGYKSNREAKPPVALEQLNRVKRRCEADGLTVFECRGFEGEDIFATICERLLGEPHQITLASSDKDCAQLVEDPRVRLLHPFKDAIFDRAKVIEKFGVSPDMLGDLLALTGDASDGIPGVPGVGPKTAAKLLLEFGTLEGVLTHTDDIPQPVLRQRLLENGPAARLARRLVELRTDAPIDVEELFKERTPKPLVENEMDEPLDSMGPEVTPPTGSAIPADVVEKIEPENQKTALVPAPPKPEKKGSGLATYQGPEFDRGLEPATLDAAWRLAGGILNSRLYSKFTSQEAIWAIIVRGREMGLGAVTSLDCIHFFEGKPALSAHLIIARAKSHPECEYFQLVESTPELARYTTKRRGNPEPTNLTYTIDDARRAGVIRDRGPWTARPAEMLRKSCGVQLARVEFPEALLGAYAMEELGGDE